MNNQSDDLEGYDSDVENVASTHRHLVIVRNPDTDEWYVMTAAKDKEVAETDWAETQTHGDDSFIISTEDYVTFS